MSVAIPINKVKFPVPETVFEVAGREYTVKRVHMFMPNEGILMCEGRLPGHDETVEYVVFDFNILPVFDVFGGYYSFEEEYAVREFKDRILL